MVLFMTLTILGLVVLGFPTLAAEINMATLSLSPSADNFSVDSEFEVAVILDTGGQAVNVIDVIVYFPEDLIEVAESPTRDGLLPLWQFNASNEKGEINIVGGERQEGVIASNSEITRIRFKVKKEGKAILKISSKNSNIIAADGLGTKIPIKAGQAYYILISAPVIVETPEVPKLEVEPPTEVQPREFQSREDLKAAIPNLIQWAPLRAVKVPIGSILKTNFAGLLTALVAIIYNSRKKKT